MKKSEFPDFYKTTYTYFKGLMYVILNKFDEDVLQQSYINLFENCERHDPARSNIKTYFMRIIINEFIRVKNIKKKIDVVDVDVSIFRCDEPDESDEEMVLLMYGYLETLPWLHQNIIKDYYFNNLSYQDIADKYDMKLGTMKTRMRIAKRFIRKKMEKNH